MKTVKKRSVIPVYGIAAAWLLFTIFHGIAGAIDIAIAVVLSAIVFIALMAIFPTKIEVVPDSAQKQSSAQKAAAPQAPAEDPEITALKQERDRAVAEMRRLNANIPDPEISRSIGHLESTTAKIFEVVIGKPEKKAQITQFLNYFLPTTIKLLNAYDRADSAGISGENIDNTKEKVRQMLHEVETAFDRQLDSLFGAEALDISTDIKVMETMLAQEGLSDDPFGTAAAGGAH